MALIPCLASRLDRNRQDESLPTTTLLLPAIRMTFSGPTPVDRASRVVVCTPIDLEGLVDRVFADGVARH